MGKKQDIDVGLYQQTMIQVYKSLEEGKNLSFIHGNDGENVTGIIIYHDRDEDGKVLTHYIDYPWRTAIFNALSMLYQAICVAGEEEVSDYFQEFTESHPRMLSDFIIESIQYVRDMKERLTRD